MDELPDGYPVEEGVGLWCPRCRVAFWHVPPPDAAPTEPPASRSPDAVPADAAPPPAAAALSGASPEAAAVVAASAPRLPAPGGGGPSVWPAIVLVALTALLVLAVVVALASRGGERDRDRDGTARGPAPTATATAAEATAPSPPDAVAVRRLAGATVSVRLPGGWAVRRRGLRLVASGGGERVTVSAAPRRGRSLARLARDTRAALGASSAVAVRRVRLGALPAARVRARRREITALVLGRWRWLVARDVREGAAVARSVRISPGRRQPGDAAGRTRRTPTGRE